MDLTELYFRVIIAAADVIGENKCFVCHQRGDVFCKTHFEFFIEDTGQFTPDSHWWFWYYHSRERDIILDIKKHHRFRMSYRLGQLMGEYLHKHSLNSLFDVITYVPHHPKEFAATRFSLPYLLALGISDVLTKPVETLFVKNKLHSQHVLSKEDRKRSLESVYNISRNILKVDKILIVDDIITTGNTLARLKNLLHERGINSVYTITLAKTPKWSDVV